MVRLLLHAGMAAADVNARDAEGQTAAHWAARCGNAEALRALVLEGGADVQLSCTARGERPLHLAARYGQAQTLRLLLLELRADATARSAMRESALDVAGWYPMSGSGSDATPTPVGHTPRSDCSSVSSSNASPNGGSGGGAGVGLGGATSGRVSEGSMPGAPLPSGGEEWGMGFDERACRAARAMLFACAPQLRTVVLWHSDCLQHATPQRHQESPLRQCAILDRLREEGLFSFAKQAGPAVPLAAAAVVAAADAAVASSSASSPPNSCTAAAATARTSAEVAAECDAAELQEGRWAFEAEFCSDFPLASRAALLLAHDRAYVDMVFALDAKIGALNTSDIAGRGGWGSGGGSLDVSGGLGSSGGSGGGGGGDGGMRIVPFTPHVQRRLGTPDDELKLGKDSDTCFSSGSLAASRRAAGAVMSAVDRVISGACRNAFCAVRPPGHHSGSGGLSDSSGSCGFCIFNSVAIGAIHALNVHATAGVRRVAIVDIDVHHGNGTQEIVQKLQRPDSVFFFSIHICDTTGGHEFYPGSGQHDDLVNNVVNVPIAPLWKTKSRKNTFGGRASFRQQLAARLFPTLRAFNPDLILLSAGFDAGKHDIGNSRIDKRYLDGMDVEPEDYAWVSRKLQRVADVCCDGRLVSVLEGGYGRYERKQDPKSPINRDTLAAVCEQVTPPPLQRHTWRVAAAAAAAVVLAATHPPSLHVHHAA